MLVTEGHGLPIGLHVASATPHEMALVDATLRSIRVPRRGRGRPKSRVAELVADKAYDSRPFRQSLRHRGIKPTIPVAKRPAHWRPRIGRPPSLAHTSPSDGRSSAPTPGWTTTGDS